MSETLTGIDTEFDVIAHQLAEDEAAMRRTIRSLDACIARHKAMRAAERGPAAVAIAAAGRILNEEAAKHLDLTLRLDQTGLALMKARRRIEAEALSGALTPAPIAGSLGDLIERGRTYVMSPEERAEQQRSWVRGEMAMERVAPSDEPVDDLVARAAASADRGNG